MNYFRRLIKSFLLRITFRKILTLLFYSSFLGLYVAGYLLHRFRIFNFVNKKKKKELRVEIISFLQGSNSENAREFLEDEEKNELDNLFLLFSSCECNL